MNEPHDSGPDSKRGTGVGLWLVLSLAANLFLVVFLYSRSAATPALAPAPPAAGGEVVLKTNTVVRRENFTWDQVESTNYQLFVSNLRAIGCPEQTIRDIVISDFDRVYTRRKLAEIDYPNFQWWLFQPDPAVLAAAADKLAALETERRGILRQLLGNNWEHRGNDEIAAAAGITLTGPVLGELSQAAKDAAFAAVAKAQLKIEAYEAARKTDGKPVDPVELVKLREEPYGALSAALGPAAYQEFLLRFSPGAQWLRTALRETPLAPARFRDLFNAEFSVVSQPAFYYAGPDAEAATRQRALAAQTDAIMKSVLGDQDYAAIRLAADPAYQKTVALARKLEVPESTVATLYQINRATRDELNRIRNDANMSADEKVEALSQAQVEQQQTLQQMLGPEAFERWLKSNTNSD